MRYRANTKRVAVGRTCQRVQSPGRDVPAFTHLRESATELDEVRLEVEAGLGSGWPVVHDENPLRDDLGYDTRVEPRLARRDEVSEPTSGHAIADRLWQPMVEVQGVAAVYGAAKGHPSGQNRQRAA